MSFRVKINRASVIQKALATLERKALPVAQKRALSLFLRYKNTMLRRFDNHPVTLELKKGARGVALTDATDGYGNLFAFIGFEGGSRPTEPLRDLLESTNLRPSIIRNGLYYFRFNFPSRAAIENASPMPWEGGNSWVSELEKGSISNLSHFLYKKFNSGSRSGWGIQTPEEIDDSRSFQKTPYITEILANFRDKVNNITEV